MSWIIAWGAFSLSVFAVARVAHGDCGRGGLWDPEICLLLGPGFYIATLHFRYSGAIPDRHQCVSALCSRQAHRGF